MKKLVFSACALTLTCGTAVANNSDWDQLDNDVQALSANLQDMEGSSMTIGGRIRAVYSNNSDADLGGFNIDNASLFATGTTAAGIGYRLEYDFATPGVDTTFEDIASKGEEEQNVVNGVSYNSGLLDAYIDVSAGDTIDIRIGQFR
ncbi:MAG: porin, partial [Planctomycetota bacterium]|nr:porin [Planctomycetota bacterium]